MSSCQVSEDNSCDFTSDFSISKRVLFYASATLWSRKQTSNMNNSCHIIITYWFKAICSNQNCGLSRTHATNSLYNIQLSPSQNDNKLRLLSSFPVSNFKQTQPLLNFLAITAKAVPSSDENRAHLPPLLAGVFSSNY